jgi:hypothetical protein
VVGRKDVAGSEGRFYVCDLRTIMMGRNEHALEPTVTENIAKFTKREVTQAREAREMLAKMRFPSVSDAIDMANSCKNLGVCGRDFQVADAILGKDASSMKGKTKKRASAVADISVKPAIVQQQQVLSIDVMFIEKIPFLIGVATPLDLTIVTSLISLDLNRPSRAAEAVRRGILYFYGVLSSQNFQVEVIMSDGEGAVGKLMTELNSLGMEVDVSGAGGHVPRVERRIQLVKERVRAHTHYMPLTMSLSVKSMCVLYVVSRLNFIPRSEGVSSRESHSLGESPTQRGIFGAYSETMPWLPYPTLTAA